MITLGRSAFSQSVGLPDAEHVRIVLDHRRLVVIDIEVIRCREMSQDARESRFAALTVHAVTYMQFESTETPRCREKDSTHPESCASCARMMDNRRLRSRKSHAAL